MRTTFALVFVCVATFSRSQDIRHFRFGMGTGYLAAGNIRNGGLTYFEPAYQLNNALAFGMRLELATGLLSSDGGLTFIGSYGINTQYYFLNGKIRPYAGIGVGLYSPSRSGSLCDCDEKYKTNEPGFYPRIGLEYGHFVFDIEYNFIQDTRVTTTSILPFNGPNTPSVSYMKTSYLSTKFGFFLGGGRKQKSSNGK